MTVQFQSFGQYSWIPWIVHFDPRPSTLDFTRFWYPFVPDSWEKCRDINNLWNTWMFTYVRIFANIQMFGCSMFANVRMFAHIRMFGCSMFECSLKFDCSKDRMFACSMFECSLIYFSNPCSRVRMFAEHERTFEYRTQMFIVRWALTKITILTMNIITITIITII